MKKNILKILSLVIMGTSIIFVVALISLLIAEKYGDKPTQKEVEVEQKEIQSVEEPAGAAVQQAVVLPELNYTYEELELLAHLIEAESGGDSELEMWYTGSVALNRMKSGKYPDTLEGVIYQSGQYECTWNGHINKVPSDVAYEIAAELLKSGGIIPDYVLYQAEFEQGNGIYEKINNTYYCY